jgi:putative tricarboxylic transport membrane protein
MNFINDKNKVGSSLILLFSLIYLNAAFDIPLNQVLGGEIFTARTLPQCLSIVTIVVCLIQLSMSTGSTQTETISKAVSGFQWRPCVLLTLLMLFYGLSFNFLGFVIATFVFLLSGFIILGERRYLLCAGVSLALAIIIWGALTQVFDIYLDSGSLFRLVAGGE